jgi:alkylation response protein AidB-like acyl-CoA dehydrogenase
MNFDFSDDQKQLRDEARRFLAEHCPPKAVREVLEGKQPYDRALWKGLAEMASLASQSLNALAVQVRGISNCA